MEPHMSSPSPCNYNAKLIKHETQPLTKQGSFTSVQMVHTHTTLSHTLFREQLCHTHRHSFTHNFITRSFATHTHAHTSLSHTHTTLPHTNSSHATSSHTHTICHTHTTLSYTTLSHTQLRHTHDLLHTTLSHTHSFVTDTTLSHTLFREQLCHTHRHSFTHNFITRNFATHTRTHLCHTHIQLFHTQSVLKCLHTEHFTATTGLNCNWGANVSSEPVQVDICPKSKNLKRAQRNTEKNHSRAGHCDRNGPIRGKFAQLGSVGCVG